MNTAAGKKLQSVKFYALAISVLAHALGLSLFAVVKLSQTQVTPLKSSAVVTISRVHQLTQLQPLTPKPKVVPSPAPDSRIIQKTNQSKITGQNPEPAIQIVQPPGIQNHQVITSQQQPAKIEYTPPQVEFFNNTAQARRICYVVDCSGSMQGLWGTVKKELFESIGQLQHDQYFCIIVFGAGSTMATSSGKMVRATEHAKNESYNFLNSLNPAGSTNALAALQQAIKVLDTTGHPPDVIYFLTDGFELSQHDGLRFAHQVMTMIRSFAPKIQINTIGLWPAESDKKTLETIAHQSGGKFTLVTDMEHNQ